MSALPTKTQPSSGTRTQLEESLADDAVLARLVQQGLRDLARHSCAYAAVFASKRGARLAHHLTVGDIDQLSESGRRTLANLYRLTQAALTVEPGLDTNTLVDRVTGRRDPRRDAGGWAREFDWSTRNPDDYLVEFEHRAQGLGVDAEHPERIMVGLDQAVPSQPLVDPLSMREMQVLKFLDSELSAPEVARQLFVSHNTVRTHTRHIFAKLQVTTRRAAVLRARECGLL
jgi:DNA-binding CsgD family transcriptional regulator